MYSGWRKRNFKRIREQSLSAFFYNIADVFYGRSCVSVVVPAVPTDDVIQNVGLRFELL